MPSTLWFAALYITAFLCLTLTFIIVWLKNFRETRRFMPIGVALLLVVLVMDVAALYLAGTDAIGKPPWLLVLMIAVTSVRIYACAVVGTLLAHRLRVSHLGGANTHGATVRQPSYGVSTPSREALIYAMLATAFMVLYSVVLFRLSGASIAAGIQGEETLPIGISSLGIFLVAAVGLSEEIIFRLGLQTGLAYLWRSSRFGHHWAVLGTTILWCVGHVGALDPGWVKIVQIFVFGLVLGYLNRRFGVVPCIITHVLFNVVMAMLVPTLLEYGALIT